LDHCRIENHTDAAFIALDGVKASVRNSVSSGNLSGFSAGGLNRAAELNIENCLVTNNSAYGIVTINFDGTIRVSGSTVTNNGTGFAQSGSLVLESFGNNRVRGNTTNASGTITTVPSN
jgi:hypothetical protein